MWRARLEAWHLKFWNWMSGSGTILWSRLLFFANAVLAVAVATDMSAVPWFKEHPQYLIYWNMFAAVVTEMIRKSNTEYETRTVYIPDYGHVDATMIVDKQSPPPPKG